MKHNPDHRIFNGWRELLRIPNLFTVPGDVLAGAALAYAGTRDLWLIALAISISLCLYAAGLFLNDYCDRKKDARERPERPLPSGKIQPEQVLAAAVLLIVVALLAGLAIRGKPHFFFSPALPHPLVIKVVSALAALIVSYNVFARKVPWAGFGVMGMCRGANLLLGASLYAQSFTPLIWMAAGAEALYITAVTAAAYRETDTVPPSAARWLPLGGAAALLFLFLKMPCHSIGGVLILIVFFGRVAYITARKQYGPDMIGQLVRALILLQAALAAAVWPDTGPGQTRYWVTMVFLAGMYYLSSRTAKTDHAS